jgi:hypothetical protein
MLMNSSRSGRKIVHEELSTETPMGTQRTISRTVSRRRSYAEPVVEAMQSMGRRFRSGDDQG